MEDGNNRVHSEDIMYSKPYMSDAEIHLRYSRGVSIKILSQLNACSQDAIKSVIDRMKSKDFNDTLKNKENNDSDGIFKI